MQANWRGWLGPLGRYRPSIIRKDMAHGFRNCDLRALPGWAHLPRWSSPEERMLEGLDLRGQVVYDIGAYRGAYSLFFSRQVGPAGRVVAFEPEAKNFKLLRRNLDRNQVVNAMPLRMALGASRSLRRIYSLPGMPTTASLADEARTPLRRARGEACVESLDALLDAVALPQPNFLKIDVEGMELEVLRGARRTLGRQHPGLLIELHGCSRRHKSGRAAAVAALLEPLGYALLHAESGQVLHGANASAFAHGHIFAAAGM
jgi:FkbM family methyltransferase